VTFKKTRGPGPFQAAGSEETRGELEAD